MFASEGARIAAIDVDAPPLQATADATRAAGGDLVTFVTDVADEGQAREPMAGTVEHFGELHILYNTLAVQFAPHNVRVNCISRGSPTPRCRGFALPMPHGWMPRARRSPFGRLGGLHATW